MNALVRVVSETPQRSRGRIRLALIAIPALGIGAALVPSVASASASTATISSAGPLTAVAISSDLNCAVNHSGDSAGEWFANTACGTLLAVNGTLYGPASIPAGSSAAPRTTWTEVSQSAVTGSGTNASPYTVVTVVAAGTDSVQLTQTDSYVVGEESYNTDISVKNTGSSAVTAVLYRAGDCFLQNSDFGFGIVDAASGAVTCTTSLDPGSRIEQMRPLTAGSNYIEDFFATVWGAVGSQNQLPNTCQCASDIDNGLGLSWPVSLAAGATKTFSSLVTFSPLGRQPLTLTKTADAANAAPGSQDGYTITATNPNSTAVVMGSVTDTLPAGFSYVSGTTTGATTTNPTIVGQDLTFGPISAPAGGTASIHFNVTVSSTPGTYTNSADGLASGYTVIGTGATAPITVAGVAQSVTLTKTADSATAAAGGQDGYTITATNPNAGAVSVTAVDTLPAGFSYRTGTTTGATTANPSIVGQVLTFAPISVPGSGTASIHFGVNVSTTPGTYTNSVDGSADGYTVVGTGPTAPITVTPVSTSHSVTGQGTVHPASGGRPTAFTFGATKTGTTLTGSATVTSPKGTFVGSTVTTFKIVGNVGTVTVTGTWKGLPGYTLVITATDGSPDHVKFVVKKGAQKAFSVTGVLDSGNVSVS